MRLKLLTLALTLATVSAPSYGEDLLDAYRQARANDPVLAQAEAQNLSVREGVPQARALYLPQINGAVSLQQVSGSSAGTDGTGTDTGVTGGLNTGNFGHERSRSDSIELDQQIINIADIANLHAAKSTADSQEQLYQAAVQELFVRVATAYFTVLNDEDQLTFAKANEEAYKQQYDQADQQYKVGLSAITNVYQAKSYYESAKATTITTQNTLADDRQALTQITGKPTGELKKLRPELPLDPPNPSDPDTWVQNSLKYNPNVISAQYSVDAAEHDINAARAGHLPTLSASVSRGKTTSWLEHGSDAYSGNGRLGTTIGVTLSVPIFAGGATQSKVRQSIDNRDSAQDSLESERRLVQRDTLNYYNSILAGISEVQSGKAAVDSGQKALDATKAGFQVGTQTFIDVLLAIQTLTQAESTYSAARHQLVLNNLLLKESAGSIDYKDLEAANSLLQ